MVTLELRAHNADERSSNDLVLIFFLSCNNHYNLTCIVNNKKNKFEKNIFLQIILQGLVIYFQIQLQGQNSLLQ